nr:hypothetical protein [Microcystis aeruginosa]
MGRRGDNLTPHHVPSNAYMKAKIKDYTTNQGIAIMMEHLSPGKGGRHRQTLSYGKSPDLTLSPRQTLGQEVWDIRSIYLPAKQSRRSVGYRGSSFGRRQERFWFWECALEQNRVLLGYAWP